MRKADEITVVIGVHQITRLLHEIGENSSSDSACPASKGSQSPQNRSQTCRRHVPRRPRLFGLLLYGYSVTEWNVEMLVGPLSSERDDVSESLGLPSPITGD